MLCLEGDLDVEFAWNAGDTPGILLLVFVIERLDAHRLLDLREFGGVPELEEFRCVFHQPPRVYCGNLTHVLLRCHHQFVVDHPETFTNAFTCSIKCIGGMGDGFFSFIVPVKAFVNVSGWSTTNW